MSRANLLIVVFVLVLLMAVWVTSGKVPEPGSKEDPLVTKTYVDWHARWRNMKLNENSFLKLGLGTQFVITEPMDHPVHLKEHNLEDAKLINLTEGEVVTESELIPLNLYIVASEQEARLTFGEDAEIIVRGLKP